LIFIQPFPSVLPRVRIRPSITILRRAEGLLQAKYSFTAQDSLAHDQARLLKLNRQQFGRMKMKRMLLAAVVGAICLSAPASYAADVVEEWASVKLPPPPQLKEVTVNPKTTALLVLDIIKPVCNAERYPRCPGTVPTVKKLITASRAKGMMVVYTTVLNVPKTVIYDEVAPAEGDPVVAGVLDKFLHTDLEKILKDKGITTVLMVGTVAQGAVIMTGSQAAELGFSVVVPVDAISGNTAFPELYAVWHLANAPIVAPKVTLTRSTMIKF
jgi:nicotinamidase-related amidase